LKCYVYAGYAEVEENKHYNSQMAVGPEGDLVSNCRKHHLYANDFTWATPGSSF
jgi:predicted amidohydrolase